MLVLKYFHVSPFLANEEETVMFEWSDFVKNVFVLQKSPQGQDFWKPIEIQINSYVVLLAFSSLATSGIIGFLVLFNGRLKNGEVSNAKKAWHFWF